MKDKETFFSPLLLHLLRATESKNKRKGKNKHTHHCNHNKGEKHLLTPMMFKKNRVVFNSFKAAAESFREYLKYSDTELPSLESIFPKTKLCGPECVTFHRELCQTMLEDGHQFIGIKVIPVSYEGIQCFRESSTASSICVPLFSCHTGHGTLDMAKYRVQFVEASICIRLGDSSTVLEPSALYRSSACSVALEIVGTRFPFYPPSIASLACDLGGLIGFYKGAKDYPVQEMTSTSPWSSSSSGSGGEEGGGVVNHHFVLTHNGEPVQVGCGKLCHGGSPFVALQEAIRYAGELKMPLERDHVILCSGACPRFPAQRGQYMANWGMFGSTSCALK